jgi:hypothetical protein
MDYNNVPSVTIFVPKYEDCRTICQLLNLETRQSQYILVHYNMYHLKTVLGYYIVKTQWPNTKWLQMSVRNDSLQSVIGIWTDEIPLCMPPNPREVHPPPLYMAVSLHQPLLVLQFRFSQCSPVCSNNSYKQEGSSTPSPPLKGWKRGWCNSVSCTRPNTAE